MHKWQLSGLLFAVGASASSFAACVSNTNAGPRSVDAGLPTTETDGAAITFDASPATGGDAGAGATSDGGSSPPTAGDDGGAIQDASFVDVFAPSSWSYVDTAAFDAGFVSFSGATYDGRYAYFCPDSYNGSVVGRLDTQQDFTSPSAWTSFRAESVLPGAGGFTGAVFDGQYVYFVPFFNSTSKVNDGFDQTFVRYDTHSDFTTGTSWAQFDGSDVASGPFWGGTFDGRYVYYTSYFNTDIVWYDTQAPFTSDTSWHSFVTATLSPPPPSLYGAPVYAGSVFDGKYVYFIGPVVARHDTTALADAGASSWETYSIAGDAGPNVVYQSGAFDGRYLYLANRSNDVIARCDTQGSFSAASSWSTFDVSTAGGGGTGFFAMNFDGSHLYLAPNGTTIAMLDTQAPFASASSWTTFNAATVTSVPTGYETLLFDGQYMYTASESNTQVLRLQVKAGPAALPALPLWHGSFF